MVGRASVTRELGSPAGLPDRTVSLLLFLFFIFSNLTIQHSRRSSSKASHRTAPAPELKTTLTQSSYSLPATPLTSSFDEFLPSAKRRRTQRTINSEDKSVLPATGTPTHRAFSEPFQAPKSHSSARSNRASNLTQSNAQTQVQDTSIVETELETPPRANSHSHTSEPHTDQPNQQSDQPPEHPSIHPQKSPPRKKSNKVKTERDKLISTDYPATMFGEVITTRRTLNSNNPADWDLTEEELNSYKTKYKESTSPEPAQSRRKRTSRKSASSGAKTRKPPTAPKKPFNPTAAKGKSLDASTPAKQPVSSTPNSSSRSTRRDRKSIKTAPVSNQPTTQNNENEHRESQSPNKPSNTVRLNVGRKSLETIMAQQKPEDHEMIDSPGQENGHYHLDHDTDMYSNNFGLDGHMDAPTSPTSLSTTTSTAARMSGRTRKPTVRALESVASEQRHRRPRAPSAKPAETTETTPATMRCQQKSTQASPVSPARKVDVMAISKQMFELAAAAVGPDFVPAPEVDTWLKELHQSIDEKKKEKENEAIAAESAETIKAAEAAETAETVEAEEAEELAEPAELEAEPEREATPLSDKPFQDNVQASMPWTDADGWEHTGQVNKHEEEYTIIPPTYEWHRPNNTYGDDELPLPPIRVRSLVQAEKDRAFGYPPRIGDRNIPVDNNGIFLFEDAQVEKAKLDIKEAARARGIWVSSFWTQEQVETMVQQYDDGKPPKPPAPEIAPIETAPVEVKPKESSRKRRRTENASASHPGSLDTPRPKRRRQKTNEATPEPNAGPVHTLSPGASEAKKGQVTLKFEGKRLLMGQILDGSYRVSPPKKRRHSDIGDNRTENAHPPSTPANATIQPEKANTTQLTPESKELSPPDSTPGSRPRRRAADALMANLHKQAEARAQRSERARIGHARRKAGTPLKTVTDIHGDTAESPVRPAVDSMNLD